MSTQLWKTEIQETSPVKGVRIQSQAFTFSIPFINTVLTWNRPLVVLVEGSNGEIYEQRILDVTRIAITSLILAVLFSSLLIRSIGKSKK